jgi:N,N'-diacetyllegionaminate synthase
MKLKNNNTYIIAELGVNHNGKLSLAKKMIKSSKKAGADAIKIQSFISNDMTSGNALTAKYQSKKKFSQIKLLKKYEFSETQQILLYKYCKKIKIDFLSSAFDLKSLKLLKKLYLKYYKIPSGEITNLPLLEEFGRLKKKVLLSTGMSTIKEIKKAISVMIKNGLNRKDLVIFHCTSSYPTKIDDANLRVLTKYKHIFKTLVGYSDHTTEIQTASVAVALGASFIEKHVTLNKKMSGPDHKSSLNFEELKKMIDLVRKTERLMGSDNKIVTKSESNNMRYVRKSIVASKNIKKGSYFTKFNLTTKRPGHGMNPFYINRLYGKKSKKNFKLDDLISI